MLDSLVYQIVWNVSNPWKLIKASRKKHRGYVTLHTRGNTVHVKTLFPPHQWVIYAFLGLETHLPTFTELSKHLRLASPGSSNWPRATGQPAKKGSQSLGASVHQTTHGPAQALLSVWLSSPPLGTGVSYNSLHPGFPDPQLGLQPVFLLPIESSLVEVKKKKEFIGFCTLSMFCFCVLCISPYSSCSLTSCTSNSKMWKVVRFLILTDTFQGKK